MNNSLASKMMMYWLLRRHTSDSSAQYDKEEDNEAKDRLIDIEDTEEVELTNMPKKFHLSLIKNESGFQISGSSVPDLKELWSEASRRAMSRYFCILFKEKPTIRLSWRPKGSNAKKLPLPHCPYELPIEYEGSPPSSYHIFNFNPRFNGVKVSIVMFNTWLPLETRFKGMWRWSEKLCLTLSPIKETK